MSTTSVDYTESSSDESTADEPCNLQTALQESIQSINADRLRNLVQRLCEENVAVVEWLGKHLVVQEDDAKRKGKPKNNLKRKLEVAGSAAAEETLVDARSTSGQKRLQSRYVMCSQCDEEYDVTENSAESCSWHLGMALPYSMPK